MIGRTMIRWTGAVALAAALVSPHAVGAGSPVHELQIVTDNFMFEPSTIEVTEGEQVRLVVRSRDRTHGFSIPKLKIDARVPKSGEAVTVEFTAPPAGRYQIACSEFCGRGHGQMKAELVSVGAGR
jgi:cytochrome c oxidase subunit II